MPVLLDTFGKIGDIVGSEISDSRAGRFRRLSCQIVFQSNFSKVFRFSSAVLASGMGSMRRLLFIEV